MKWQSLFSWGGGLEGRGGGRVGKKKKKEKYFRMSSAEILPRVLSIVTHCIWNRLYHTIYWKSPISILGKPGYGIYIFLEKNGVLRRLIWVCTVCQVPFYGSPDYNGLNRWVTCSKEHWRLKHAFANSVDPDEMAYNKPSHRDVYCLPFWIWFLSDIPICNSGCVQNQGWNRWKHTEEKWAEKLFHMQTPDKTGIG